jgi:GntR family transcriptional repressor for pyruvate dehydrogenase complex
MKAREIVECGAARLAAEQADSENIERLQKVSSRLRADCGSVEIYYRNDFAFHMAVAEASNNPAISEIVKMLVDKSHHHIGFMSESLDIAMPVNAERCVNTAQKVVSFIEIGDGTGSEAAMREHLDIIRFELAKEFPGNHRLDRKGRPVRLFQQGHRKRRGVP